MTDENSAPLIAAISGGVDSIVMLDVLRKQQVPFVVAHVNHGIRPASDKDEEFVRSIAKRLGLPFESTRLKLGQGVSENEARNRRYAWFDDLRKKYDSEFIATAHHEDDIFETIIINLLRGTGWRGLASLRETQHRIRPLLSWTKADIVTYALDNELPWREDETNDTPRYLRNRIRSMVVPRMTPMERSRLRALYDSQVALRSMIETEIARLYTDYCEDGRLLRHPLIMMPDEVAIELIRLWLPYTLESSRFRDVLLFLKTAHPGAKWSIDKSHSLLASQRTLIVLSSRG